MKNKRKFAKLRVCASCEWIFKLDNDTGKGSCPKCGFAHYGAYCVYGNKCYRYAKNQLPWINRKLERYALELNREVYKSMRK